MKAFSFRHEVGGARSAPEFEINDILLAKFVDHTLRRQLNSIHTVNQIVRDLENLKTLAQRSKGAEVHQSRALVIRMCLLSQVNQLLERRVA